MKNHRYISKLWLVVGLLGLFGVTVSIAQAEILYDGANTSGVTTDDQYIIDYDQTALTNRDVQFGNASNYLRYDVVNNKFLLSTDLDLQSFQLKNTRAQNVASTADVPACAVPGDAGKMIFATATFVNTSPAQTLTVDQYYVCNAAGTAWLGLPTGFSASDFLRANTNTTYVGGGAGNNTITFNSGDILNPVNINFTANSTTNLPQTTSNTFTINNDAANGDTSTLSFGDGSGQLIWNDTTSTFSTGSGNNFTTNGTATSNALVVNASGSVNLNNNQVQNLTMENVSALPGSPTTGRLLFLTANDTTAPGCSVAVPCTAGSYYFNGTKWVRDSADGGSATLEFSPQYKDGVVRPDGSNNVGTMSSDTDTATNLNYYRWTSTNASFQDIDIAVDLRLPDDFGGFAATTPLQYDIRSNDNDNTKAKLDISGKDTSGTAITFTGTVAAIAPTVANTWQPKSNGITGGTFAAGSRMQLIFKLSTLRNVTSRNFDMGDFRLNYVRKSP